jgi:drug/metabolite transporter (DMT)-like permease
MELSENARGALWMSIAMGAFTLNDTCMKAVTAVLPLYEAIALRGFLTMTAIALIGWRAGTLTLRIAPADRTWLLLRTVGEVGGTVTFLNALRHMPLANLSAILQSLPLAVTLAAALLLREAVGWRRLLAIAVGFCGVMLIIRPGTEGFDRWSVLGLASVGFVVLRDLATRRLSSGLTSVTVAFSAAASVTVMGFAMVPFSGWVTPGADELALIAGASVFLFTGYILIVMAMRSGDIGHVAPFRYTSLIFALVLGWVIFGQFPDRLTFLGGIIVIATGIYTFHRERARGQIVAQPVKAPLRMR